MLVQQGKEERGKATNVEALAYLYTASLSVPLTSEYSEIYFYLTRKSLDWQNKKEVPEFLKDYEKLDDYKTSLLDDLKRDIYNAQEKAYKKRPKLETDEPEAEKEDKESLSSNIEQLKLF